MSINKKIENQFIIPQWPVDGSIKSLVTTRRSTTKGLSLAPYNDFNLAEHVGDNFSHVEKNRLELERFLPHKPVWLNQIHSQRIIEIDQYSCYKPLEDADGSFTTGINQVCSVMTADCLPILFCSKNAQIVSAIHVGWRGLVQGIIDSTVQLMMAKKINKRVLPANQLMAWLGPAISQHYFEVGAKVRDQFIKVNAQYGDAFIAQADQKYMADIYLLAKINLQKLGVTDVYGGDYCTYRDSQNFYSYRREGQTGRMASLIWRT